VDPLPRRDLNPREKKIAEQVFRDTLPFWRISVGPGLGQGRAYTLPDPGSIILTLGVLPLYVLQVGPEGYLHGMEDPRRAPTLVHELTHVWQGVNASGFVFDSLCSRYLIMGDSEAYVYVPGAPWEMYNVEQQASIVEDWYEKGAAEDGSSDLFPYIRDVIRILPLPLSFGIRFHPYHR
jgi:hypothetical protein